MKKLNTILILIILSSCGKKEGGTPPPPIVLTVPNAPTELKGVLTPPVQIDLTWVDASNNEDGYKIERKSGTGAFSLIATLGQNVVTYSDKGLSTGTTYTYRVFSYNSKGNSINSNEIAVKTEDAEVALLKVGLVAFYPFTGNAGDSSGNGNHGTVNGAKLISDRFSNTNKAYEFDGTNDITVPHKDALNLIADMSVSLWFDSYGPPNFRTSHTFIAKRTSSTCCTFPYLFGINYQVGIPSDLNKTIFVSAVSNNYQYHQSQNSIENNKWNHVVFNISGSTLKVYLNGILFSTNTIDNKLRDIKSINSGALLIGSGGRLEKPAEQMVGKLDEIRIYSRALTESEITYLFKN